MAVYSCATLVKLLAFSLLFGAASGVNDEGYLFLNLSQIPHCAALPANKLCSLRYKTVEFDGPTQVVQVDLTIVNVTLASLDFFPGVTSTCRESVRDYVCSNVFPICNGQGKTLTVRYNVSRTEQACARAIATCPSSAQLVTVYNCTNIIRNAMDFTRCVPLPDVGEDICPETNYKFPEPSAKMYPQVMRNFRYTVAALKPYISASCLDKFININCNLNRGPICSEDEKLRIYALSRQDCRVAMQECLPGRIGTLYQTACNVLPDAKTAPRVPLPPGITVKK